MLRIAENESENCGEWRCAPQESDCKESRIAGEAGERSETEDFYTKYI